MTGHEASRTEWGYGGHGKVDQWCRWCDFCWQVPLQEQPPPFPITADMIAEVDMTHEENGRP